MPPQISAPSVLRQCRASFAQLSASLSTTAKAAAFKPIAKRTPSSSLLDLGSNSSKSSSGDRRLPTEAALQIWESSQAEYGSARRREEKAQTMQQQLQKRATSDKYTRHLTRRWRAGDVYAPHDLSAAEQRKWRRQTAPKRDVVDVLGINPLDMYRNFSMISEYVTPLGRIKHSEATGLRPVNQRKMAKAIRRAIGLGLHPSVHRHPEILFLENPSRAAQSIPSKRTMSPLGVFGMGRSGTFGL